MRYPREVVDEVRLQNDIVEVISQYVPLKQKGSSYFGLCPFHNEKTASFSVNSEKQFYYCFGCGAAGNVFSFLMEMENCDFPEAMKRLAERAHITLPNRKRTRRQSRRSSSKNDYLKCTPWQAGSFMKPCKRRRGQRREPICKNGRWIPVWQENSA